MGGSNTAVITGASSGIGRATALRLAREGWRVVVCARREAPLKALAEEVVSAGGEAVVEPLDAADGDAVLAMAARVLDAHGTPDVIIHSAGAGRWLWIEDTSPEEVQTMIGAPYLAAFHVTHAFMRSMIDAKRGTIVHVNSPAGIMPWAGATGYAASRFALRGLHDALRMDLVGTGVTSCHVVLGEVTSEYFAVNPGSQEHIPGIAQRWIPRSTPEQCAEVIADVVARPRSVVVYPLMLKLFVWVHAVAPWFVRFLIVRTQRTR